MSSRQPANIPIALSRVRHQFDHWRSRQRNKRARLPKELWRQAVALAREHGLNNTARALGLKYYSLKKHIDEAGADELVPAKTKPDFIELVLEVVTPGCVECMIERADGSGADAYQRRRPLGAGLSGRRVPERPSMIQVTPQMRIRVAVEPADFRKGIDGLASLCRGALRSDPFSGCVFVFCNKSRKAVKILVYDGQDFWLCRKRLSKGRFPN